ncbi:MAG: hypothetical protein M1819_003736 [Sarea resinae]|nr:MAG: hypothetical protein M1819_003736 [Sarea resinae]
MAVTSSLAMKLYVSSYSGNITSFSLSRRSNGVYALSEMFSIGDSAPSPAWLTLDRENNILYGVDEGLLVPTGSVASYRAHEDGSLETLSRQETVVGGYVFLFRTDFSILRLVQWRERETLAFTLPIPGPVPDRQEASHPHQAITDPTGHYILVPDLGADLVRVFLRDSVTQSLRPCAPLKVSPGSGPRHAVFWSTENGRGTEDVYLYVITELANTVTAYSVTYLEDGELAFAKVYTTSTFGSKVAPVGAAAAEIAISPDNRFLLLSNRNDSSFPFEQDGTMESTVERSDSLAQYRIRPDGTLDFLGLHAAGGSFPRQFSINKDGSLIAVALQRSSRVVVLDRNVKTGEIGDLVAEAHVHGEVTCVIWND